MSKKPYNVKVTVELIVMAETEREAHRFAQSNRDNCVTDAISSFPDIEADELTHIPAGWEDDALVYNSDGDYSVRQMLDEHRPDWQASSSASSASPR